MSMILGNLLIYGIKTELRAAIITTSNVIYTLINNIIYIEDVNVNKQLKQLDIIYQLKLIETILKCKQKIHKVENDEFCLIEKNDDPLDIVLDYLSEIIYDIKEQLDQLEKETINYNNKWFKQWRSHRLLD